MRLCQETWQPLWQSNLENWTITAKKCWHFEWYLEEGQDFRTPKRTRAHRMSILTKQNSLYVPCWICKPSMFRSGNYTSVRRISQIFPIVSRIFYIYHYYARLLSVQFFRVPQNLSLEILLSGYMIAKRTLQCWCTVYWIKKNCHSICWYWFKSTLGRFFRYS